MTEWLLQERSSTWKSKSLKVEVEELESLLGPDDSDVDFRRILEEARDEKGCAIYETFSSGGPSEFLVVSGWRWDKHQKRPSALWRQHSSTSKVHPEALDERRQQYFPAL